MKLGFASDHRGFALKEKLINYYKKNGYDIIDYGTNGNNSCDYPDFAYKLGQGILHGDVLYGIAICGSGIGISIALNKIKGIYCAKVGSVDDAYHTRNDNNTNCLSFGENMKFDEAIKIIDTFIHTEYSNFEKHNRRNAKIKQIENGEYDG